ncbi:MAG: ABC transporter substrate-binding protein, partial [Pseudolabrys sp.]
MKKGGSAATLFYPHLTTCDILLSLLQQKYGLAVSPLPSNYARNCQKPFWDKTTEGGRMTKTAQCTAAGIVAFIFALAAATAEAKDKVKVGFIGPLTGGVSVNGLGGRNSADLAVRLRNADPKAKYEYELVVLDDECKPNVAVQVATKMAADKGIIAGATHYCSATAIATVDVYHKFGFPVIVWGAVLPDITYRNKYDEVHRVNGTMINQNDANAELISKLGYKT